MLRIEAPHYHSGSLKQNLPGLEPEPVSGEVPGLFAESQKSLLSRSHHGSGQQTDLDVESVSLRESLAEIIPLQIKNHQESSDDVLDALNMLEEWVEATAVAEVSSTSAVTDAESTFSDDVAETEHIAPVDNISSTATPQEVAGSSTATAELSPCKEVPVSAATLQSLNELVGAGDTSAVLSLREDLPPLETPTSEDRKLQCPINPHGIQMLPQALRASLFPNPRVGPHPAQTNVANKHLKHHRLNTREPDLVPPIELPLPKLKGQDISEHFWNIGVEQAEPYLSMAEGFATLGLEEMVDGAAAAGGFGTPTWTIPPMPTQWVMEEGWTFYPPHSPRVRDSSTAKTARKSKKTTRTPAPPPPRSVPYPPDQCLVFDIEGVKRDGPWAVMAVALGPSGWYSWCSPRIVDSRRAKIDSPEGWRDLPAEQMLIPMSDLTENGRKKAKLLIGHNVGFDRARVLDEYHVDQGGARYVDTMSLHVAVAGLSSQQRGIWLKARKDAREAAAGQDFEESGQVASKRGGRKVASKENDEEGVTAPPSLLDLPPLDIYEVASSYGVPLTGSDVKAISGTFSATSGTKESGSKSPLATKEDPKWLEETATNALHIVAEHYANISLDKSDRDVFMTGGVPEVVEQFDELMTYCAKDVYATYMVFRAVWPKFRAKCPHPVSFAGLLHMGSGYLPTQRKVWEGFISSAEAAYRERMEDIERRLKRLADEAVAKSPEDVRQDPWLRALDWTVPNSPARKTPKSIALAGMPNWYRELWDSESGSIRITTSKRVSPYLLRLAWNGYPLYYSKTVGSWCYRVPQNDRVVSKTPKLDMDANKDPEVHADTNHVYYRVPHEDGEGANCGNPMGKSYMAAFEDGTLSSEFTDAKEILKANSECTYWSGSRARISEQFNVHFDPPDIIPKPSRRKSRGKAPVQPDPSVAARKYLGLPAGSSVILPQTITMGTVTRRSVEKTWMTASNAKKNRIGSELKSKIVAPDGWTLIGADVDSEELWICALMGDAQLGAHGASALGWMTLQGTKADGTDLHSRTASILGISRDQAKIFNYGRLYGAGIRFATQLLLKFNPQIDEDAAKAKAAQLFSATKGTSSQATLRRASGRSTQMNWFGTPFLHGGTESYTFNILERTAASEVPQTPVLGAVIPNGLLPKNVERDSSGVDYLHLLLVSFWHLKERLNLKARVVLTMWVSWAGHDEVRFLVSHEPEAGGEDHIHRAVLALQIANLWTRAAFSWSAGIDDLPQSVAFFSAVDVDHCLRKEVDMDCVTPSSPIKVPKGRRLDIQQTILSTGGQLTDDATFYSEDSSTIDSTVRGKLAHIDGSSAELVDLTLRRRQREFLEWRKGKSHFSIGAPGEWYDESGNVLHMPDDVKTRSASSLSAKEAFMAAKFCPVPLPGYGEGESVDVRELQLQHLAWLKAQDARDHGDLSEVFMQCAELARGRVALMSPKGRGRKGKL
ncbi:DNA-directed DNA polymerase gamma mip1 [Gonapodya sp. JEL0774]|nr:DNA-directed DNA polymerase gamma mip1 [Gonapodya sp. JEL0774]